MALASAVVVGVVDDADAREVVIVSRAAKAVASRILLAFLAIETVPGKEVVVVEAVEVEAGFASFMTLKSARDFATTLAFMSTTGARSAACASRSRLAVMACC